MKERWQVHREALEAFLREVVEGRPQPLYRLLEYHLGWTDEQGNPRPEVPLRPRGLLALLVAEALGADFRPALPVAGAVELAFQFAEVHRDLHQARLERERRPAVWYLWGPAMAINVGDSLHALARLALFRLREVGLPPEQVFAFARTLDEAVLRLCEGEYQDLQFQERLEVSLSAYRQAASARSGALMGAGLALAGRAVGCSPAQAEALERAGVALGVALQGRQEVGEVWGAEADGVPAGLLSKRKGLPIVLAFEEAPSRLRRELGTLYFKRVLEPSDLPRLRTLLEEAGVLARAREEVRREEETALALLQGAGLPPQLGEEVRAVLEACAPFPSSSPTGQEPDR